jgi:DNA-binding Xre family transcriptional regulator
MSPQQKKVSYSWHLRMVMAERGMFKTSELSPLLAARGVVLSREQVYRLVAKVPERLSLTTLAALCDALSCSPSDLIEPLTGAGPAAEKASPRQGRPLRPVPARVVRRQ